ncbi:MAG: hypothetical protein KatS3mg033_0819 [Thermonema sp.]|nr:MAG: hypothetical protein KatS3mg033_0819 [Thermonema sp.]
MKVKKTMQWMALCLTSVWLFSACKNSNEAALPQSPYAGIEQQSLQLINEYRIQNGKEPLQTHPAIYAEAYQHSSNMAEGKVPFGHDGFSARVERIRAELNAGPAAENVAYNYGPDPAQTAFEQWRNSSGHNKNMLGDYTHCGLAVAKSGDGRYYFTHIFVKVSP